MSLSLWSYVVGFILLGIFSTPLLSFIGSKAEFVSPILWVLMGLGMLIERYGAMHLQLYSTTNHIIWHIANGISGIICIIVTLFLLKPLGIYSFPVGYIAGFLGFYSWYSAIHSYRAFGLKFWKFERSVMLPPAFCFLIFSFFYIYLT